MKNVRTILDEYEVISATVGTVHFCHLTYPNHFIVVNIHTSQIEGYRATENFERTSMALSFDTIELVKEYIKDTTTK